MKYNDVWSGNLDIKQAKKSKVIPTEIEFLRRSCKVTRIDHNKSYKEEKCLIWYGDLKSANPKRWISKITDWSTITKRPRRSLREEVDVFTEKWKVRDGEWQNRNDWRYWLKEGRQRQL